MFERSDLSEESAEALNNDPHELAQEVQAATLDPYGGVALGVECAWPNDIALHSR